MTRCSVQLRDKIFVNCYGLLCFAKNMGKKVGRKISKNYSQIIVKNFFLLQVQLKLLQKEKFKIHQK